MDVVMNKAKRLGACYKCGKEGHWARACPDSKEKIRAIISEMDSIDRAAFYEELMHMKEQPEELLVREVIDERGHELVDDEDRGEQGFTDGQA